MRLDTISKMEEFITNALLSSELIPLGVNVIRLAATHDEEGIARMARSIVVRYTGSTANVQQKVPLVITRTLTFELSLASQSYLTESGHDYAVQMCAATHMLLTNQVPTNTGSQIVTPFHLTSESFEGLTDSSHYVYSQSWQVEVQELNGLIALDPCVARGNCSFLFPDNILGDEKPGDIIVGNEIWEPVLPPPPGLEYEEEYCGVEVSGQDLVYAHDKTQVFLEQYWKYSLVPTGTFDKSKQFLIVNIYDEDGKLVGTFFAGRCNGRLLIQFGGNSSGGGSGGSGGGGSGGSGGGGSSGSGGGNIGRNWVEGLWISEQESVGNMDYSNGPEPFRAIVQARNRLVYVDAIRATVFSDPSNPNAAKGQVKYGKVLQSVPSTTLTVEGVEYVQVGNTPLGKAWIRTGDIRFVDESQSGSNNPQVGNTLPTLRPSVYCSDGEIAEPSGDECD